MSRPCNFRFHSYVGAMHRHENVDSIHLVNTKQFAAQFAAQPLVVRVEKRMRA